MPINRSKNFIKKIWNDPVGSKVIAGLILLLLPILYAFFASILGRIPFSESLASIYNFFCDATSINNGLLILLFLSIAYVIVKIYRNFPSKIKEKRNTIEGENNQKRIALHPAAFFYTKVSDAFPAVRGLEWYLEPKEAVHRLGVLLREPIFFDKSSDDSVVDPIWWFRDMSSMFIQKFEILSKASFLINVEQYLMDKIAVYRDDRYEYNFVYVQTKGEKPTGVYPNMEESIKRQITRQGFASEEYGLWKNKPVRRENYDDASIVVKGKVIPDQKMDLRVRFLSPYNFIITSKDSPYNSSKFETDSTLFLNGLLNGSVKFDSFLEFMLSLRKSKFSLHS